MNTGEKINSVNYIKFFIQFFEYNTINELVCWQYPILWEAI